MFQGRIETMPIPERVFELCKIVAEEDAKPETVREKLEPSQINGDSMAYFGSVLNAAKELNLIEVTEEGTLSYIGEKQMLRKITDFRKYCNTVVWNDRSTTFYKTAVCFLNSNLEWLKYGSLTGEQVMNDIRQKTDIGTVYPDILRGMRFWMSFLGFGMVYEKTSIAFLPNMYIALKDFLQMAQIEKKKEYSVSEFIEALIPYAHVALHDVQNTHQLNYAFSSALRMMHDNKEIQLRRNPDSQQVWNLYRQEDHAVISEISHIIILKEVR